MLILIAGHFFVPAEQRQAFVDAHMDLVRRARAFPGCLDLADSVDPARVNNMELWRSETDLEAWRKICNPPKTGIRIEGGAIQKHFIARSGPPF